MKDAAGRTICNFDTVAFNSTPGDRGQVRRVTSNGSTVFRVQRVDGTIVKLNGGGDLTVVDRSYLLPGKIVAPESNLGGQLGVVTAAATALDLVRPDDDGGQAVARGVSPDELRRVRELSVGDYVVSSGQWLGRVVETYLDVDVLFDDGARCRVTEADTRKLQPVGTHFTDTRLYQGQRVVGNRSIFKASRWVSGYWKPSNVQGTVSKVKMTGVLVYWLASPRLGTKRTLIQASAPPAYQQNLDGLTFFCSGNVCNWNIGDRCFFRNPERRAAEHESEQLSSSTSSVDKQNVTAADGHESSTASHRRKYRKNQVRRLRERRTGRTWFEFERPILSVLDTHTTVDVLWQDGTRQRGVPSASLRIVRAKNEHDFFPGQRVWKVPEVVDLRGDDGPEPFGIVRSLDSMNQTVRVSWFRPYTIRPIHKFQIRRNNDETLSAYHLCRVLGHNVFYGNIVIRLVDYASRSTGEKPLPAQAASDLSWVGRVVDLGDQRIQVKWGDGNTTEVWPREIVVVKEQTVAQMLLELGDWVYEDEGDNAQGETNQEPAANSVNSGAGASDGGSDNARDTDDGPADKGVIARVYSDIIEPVIRLGGKVVEQGKRFFPASGWTMVQVPSTGTGLAASEDVEEPSMIVSSSIGNHVEETNAPAGSVQLFDFLQFDVVNKSPPDHQFLDNLEQGTTGGRKWTKRVQREWKILENDLPDTIYVRAFEDRTDLLRAVIVGVSGTPYQDGLFFFDLQLPPSSYPAAPPLVNYRSFGLRVNPNLYPSGTVCLSLLGTFGGSSTELWSPEASTVLQVLVSIQGLVLTARPYYNEAGYASQVGTPMGQRNELPYSENAYLLSLQTMLHLLRRPPVGFEDFVRDHFRRRGRHVIRACEAYREGCVVGTLDGEANATEDSSARPCSAGFRLALADVVPRLKVAFADIGADVCNDGAIPCSSN